MANNEENNTYEEQDKNTNLEKNDTANKKLIGIAVGIIGVILAVWLISSVFSGGDDDSSKKEAKRANMNSSVSKDKGFDESFKEKDKPVEYKTFNTYMPPPPPPTPIKEANSSLPVAKDSFKEAPASYTPRIVKGFGSAVLAGKKNTGRPKGIQYQVSNVSTPKAGPANNQLQGDIYTPTIARVSKYNPNLLLEKGTYIGCSLRTRIISDLPGGISCTVSNDIYSASGNVLLIEKGSVVTGTYQSGQMKDGMERLFVIWQEIRTANNIVIPVFSGGTGPLGASGVSGYVDNHYLKRFGSAILLSVIDDAFALIADNVKKNDDSVDITQNTRENANNLANQALQQFINIQPTLYKNQGDEVGIYVNKDIDFSKVYKIERRR